MIVHCTGLHLQKLASMFLYVISRCFLCDYKYWLNVQRVRITLRLLAGLKKKVSIDFCQP